MATSSLRFIDLFSGAGGLSEGLGYAGWKGVFACESEPQFARCYSTNFPSIMMRNADIQTLDPAKIRKELGMASGELDLVCGGPPYQGFFLETEDDGFADPRTQLYRNFLRFVKVFAPRAVLVEAGSNLLTLAKGETFEDMMVGLERLGYGTDTALLGAHWYGIPQVRWRIFIVGLKGRDVPPNAFPEPENSCKPMPGFYTEFRAKDILRRPGPKAAKGHVTVKEAIGDLPKIANGEKWPAGGGYGTKPSCPYQILARKGSISVANHDAPSLSAVNLERMSHVPPGGNWLDIPDELLTTALLRSRGSDHAEHSDRYGRCSPRGLSGTILSKCDPHWGAFYHYNQERGFTVREAARLQSFPDRFVFTGSQLKQFGQVGNAVPPLLAKAVGQSLKKVLK
ncbi:MAG: DNA cytosine methyltransferase [Deltaproteobacteria bacterium]|nr:DNA cytosine methyltransferase [Deltaproteobacteria bacterium]